MSTLNDIGVGLLGFTGALNQGMDRALRQRMFELQARGLDRQEALARSQIELEQQKIKQQQAEFGIAQDFMRGMQPGLLGAPATPQVTQQVAPQVSTGGSGWNANNPGNIRPVGGQGFNTYATPDDGARAMSDLLGTYGTTHGINTLVGLTSRWAPKGDGANDPTAYAQFLSKQIGGYPIDAPIDLNNPEFRAKLMQGMSQMETGKPMPQDMAMRAVSPGVQVAQAGPRTVSDAGGAPAQPQAPSMGSGVSPSQVKMALQYSMAPGKAGEMARGFLSANKAALDIQYTRSPEYQSWLKTQEAINTAKGTMPIKLEEDRLKREGEAQTPKMSDNLNFINNLAPLIANGTATEEQQRQYALAFNAEYGKIQELPDGSKVRLAPPPGNVPAPSGWVAELPGQKPLGPADAGKQASFVQAEKIVADVEAKMFPGGKFDRQTILAMQFPTSDSAAIKDDIRNAVDNIIKARTGAAAPDPEMNRYLDMFVPGPFDSEARARNKIARLKEFFRTALDVTNNRGVNGGGAPAGGNNDPLGVR